MIIFPLRFEFSIKRYLLIEKKKNIFGFRSQSVYSAVFDISDGAHCLPRLKRKINDFELNKKQERLEQLTNLQEDLAKEHNELPMGNFIFFKSPIIF